MNDQTSLDRPHVWQPGTGGPTLLMLHGTGGDENDLLPLGPLVAPGAAMLSPRGSVLEGAMPRFFRRHSEGVFDEDDLRFRVDELADFVATASEEYAIAPGSLVAVGFSNGANIAAAMLLRRPDVIAGAVLFAAMVPFASPPEVDLSDRWAIVSNGADDPMATPAQTSALVGQLRTAGARVDEVPHPTGHTIDPRTLPQVAALVAERS